MPSRKKLVSNGAVHTSAASLMSMINQQFGSGSVILGNDPTLQVSYLPTGLVPIDHLLEGGIPWGRFVEFFGDYSTLKSYVGLCAIAQCQKLGKLAALIDTENAYDPSWARALGVQTDELIYKHPENGEKAIDLAEVLIRGGVDLIVFDSVAAALPQAEQKKSMEDSLQPARQADLMSRAMRKLTAANRKTAVIWINQTRVNVGVMFGNPESVPGGKALPYYASMRISLRRAGKVIEDVSMTVTIEGKPTKKTVKKIIGQQIKATVEKSKLNSPHRETMFTYLVSEGGIDEWSYLANLGIDNGVLGYDRGRWWVVGQNPEKKSPISAFRGQVSLDQLKSMMAGKITGIDHAGEQPHVKKPVGKQRRTSSVNITLEPTQTVVLAQSPSMVRIKRRSSK